MIVVIEHRRPEPVAERSDFTNLAAGVAVNLQQSIARRVCHPKRIFGYTNLVNAVTGGKNSLIIEFLKIVRAFFIEKGIKAAFYYIGSFAVGAGEVDISVFYCNAHGPEIKGALNSFAGNMINPFFATYKIF